MLTQIRSESRLAYRATVFVTAIALGCGLAAVAPRVAKSPVEFRAQDAIVRLVCAHPARKDVVIVALDAPSVHDYGPIDSWPRSVLADGLRRVEAGHPKAVVVDLALDRRTHTGDEGLWRTIADSKNVVLGMPYNGMRDATYTPDDIRALVFLEHWAIANELTFGPQTQTFPWYDFEPPVSDFTGSSAGVGVFIREPDSDGMLRGARLFYESVVQYPQATAPLHGNFPESRLADGAPVALPSIALVAAQQIFDLDKSNVSVVSGSSVDLNGNLSPPIAIPVDSQGRMLIRYAGPAGTFETYSFRDVARGTVSPDTFKDKVVVLGATCPKDPATEMLETPFTASMPRVEVTANALQTIMDRSYFARFPQAMRGVFLLLGVVTGLSLMLVSGLRSVCVTLLLIAAYAAIWAGLFLTAHTILPVLTPLGLILITYLVGLSLSLGPLRTVTLPPQPGYLPMDHNKASVDDTGNLV